jgi:WD40 repeat protein
VWDCVKGELHPANRSDDAHTGVVNAVTQSPCGRWIATASSDDKSLRLQRADDGRVVWRRSTAYVGHNGLRFSPDGGSLYAGVGNAVAVIDVQTGQDRQRFPLDSADGAERHFHLLKFELSRDARTLLGVTQLTMGPNSRRFPNQSANYDWGIIRWDAATGRRISQAINRETKHTWVGYSGITPDCDLIVNGPVMVDPATGQERMRLRVPEESERLRVEHPLAFSADAALVAGALQHHIPLEIGGYTTRIDEVQVWEAATLRPIVRVPTGETAVLKFTPDGRHLISCGLRAITVWELPSGRQVRSFTVEHAGRGVYGPTFVTASWLSADGQTLITGLPDTTALVWRLDLPAPGPAAPLSPDKLSACWNDLGSDDAGAAWRAIDALAQRPAQALALVTPHLRPAGDLTAEVRRLLGELDAPGFDQRERASRRLAELWSDAEEQLREALNGPLGAEARRRVEALLTEPPTVRGREECRMLRVVTVLQRIGTPEARAALATLSRGAVNARLTRAAAMALTL